eukprot:gnl/Dysnectes_brevis/1281_a1436_3956.p1 GENE.gnl/Dysnectes_brevis/1281_a1436_3956~~gnl/Dysnectes_brevis/1281_a1436_3956.p1  ORF type:complete len:525 (-),score=196.40 gnl/Dysnectes_brevis/1281_a1436_3956:97-1671(-)
MDNLAPVKIFKDDTQQEKGENARLSTLLGAIAISDMVKTTMGPKGMDKILQSLTGDMKITNDGATILKSVIVDNPSARVLIDISRVQDETVGDGTTSVCVLAGELLRQAQELLDQHIHPMVIIAGFREAADVARQYITDTACDNSQDPAAFRKDLEDIARTTLSSKILHHHMEHFVTLAVDAVLKLDGSTDLSHIQIIKKPGGTMADSHLDDGFLLDKKVGLGCPKVIDNPRILIANTPMDTDKIKILGSRVRVDSHSRLGEIEAAEKKRMQDKCARIVDKGCTVFINRQLIYDVPMQYFAKKGIMAIEHADFDGIERLSLVLKGEIASTFDDQTEIRLGTCDRVEQIMIGEDSLLRFSGVPSNRASTVVLRGASPHLLDEAERSLHDALCVLSQTVGEPRTILGAGVSEIAMSVAIEKKARETAGKKALALEGFAKALRSLPVAIANNGGFDGEELVAQIRAQHYKGKMDIGLDMTTGGIMDVRKARITESYMCKLHVLLYAVEAAEQILRCDYVITAAPRQR